MKYLMFVQSDPEPDTDHENVPDIDDWVSGLDASGKRLIGDRVRTYEDATTVRIRKGELLVTDGPFTQTKDWIVGFDVLECADLDEAIEIAAAHPMARGGRLELRPFWPLDDEG